MTDYVRVDTEDYSALYVDGELEMYSDSYIVDNYLFHTVLGGQTISSEAWYMHEDDYTTMPQTLGEYLTWGVTDDQVG